MPRLPRLHVSGAFYHATLRGNHRQEIFRQESDRSGLNAIVRASLEHCGARLHAYCWMTNHLHFLVQVADVPLGKLMHRIAGGYARWFQSLLPTTGHLFERRYHALLVDADSYLLEVIRYIHLNPVRAGVVSDPGDYRWSSHRSYAGMESADWLTTDFALRMFGTTIDLARTNYLRFIGDRLETTDAPVLPDRQRADSRVLGDDAFLSRLPRSPDPSPMRITLDAIIAGCCQRFGVTVEELEAPGKQHALSRVRAVIAYQAGLSRAAALAEVARRLGRDESSVRQCLRHYLATEPELFRSNLRHADVPALELKSPESPHRHRLD